MKIIQIIPTLNSGGAERITVDICNELAKHHHVTLVQLTGQSKENLFYKSQLANKVAYLNLSGVEKKVIDLKLIFKVFNLVRKLKPDVVHTHLNIAYLFLPCLFFKKTNFFHTIHNEASKECLTLKKVSFKKLNRFFFKKRLIQAITISPESKASFNSFYKISTSLMITNGCFPKHATKNFESVAKEINSYKENEQTKVFISIGRFSYQKNQNLLVSVFNKLLNEGENCTLLIIGNGFNSEEGNQLQNMAHDKIHFLHTKENVGDYLLLSDMFCLSSLWEGLPISLLEAMSVGCYSICTPVGGILNTLINESLGIISASCDENDYYSVIKNFLKTKPLVNRNTIIEHFNKHYNIQTTVNKLTSNYF